MSYSDAGPPVPTMRSWGGNGGRAMLGRAVSGAVRGGGGLAVLYLLGSIVLAFPCVMLLYRVAPGLPERAGPAAFFGTMAVFCAAGGFLWADHSARRAGVARRIRRALAGGVAYGVSAPLAIFGLTAAETFLLEQAIHGPKAPMHIAFAILFSVATLVVVGATALAVALAAGRGRASVRLAGLSGGVAALAFLLVDVGFELAGWRVGAPGAEERFTMVVVLAAALFVATYAAGTVLERGLAAVDP